MDGTILRVDDIQKYYGNKGNLTKAVDGNLTKAVDHISFSVRKGEFLGIMGASGSGKSTLLNCISTIDTVTSGHIYVEDQDITALHGTQLAEFRGKKLGFIFQDFNLLGYPDSLRKYLTGLVDRRDQTQRDSKACPTNRKGAEHSRGVEQISLSDVRRPTAAGCRGKSNGDKSCDRIG